MANKHTNLTALFTAIADSLRRKTGTAEPIPADDFPGVIDSLSIGGANHFHVIPLTLAETGGAATAMPTILAGNAFVKDHYADEAFFAMLIPLNAAGQTHEANTVSFLYHGNRCIGNSKSPAYGVRTLGGGTTSYVAAAGQVAKISENGYVVAMRAKSSGDIVLYAAAGYKVPAGDYLLILGLAQ